MAASPELRAFIGTLAGMPTSRLRVPAPEARAFSDWLARFNGLVGMRWPGATLTDLAERPWRDWFEIDGDTPDAAVAEVERDQGAELDERFPAC